MKDAIVTKLAKLEAAILDVQHMLWTRGHAMAADVKEAAFEANDTMVLKAERCRGVLQRRYGIPC